MNHGEVLSLLSGILGLAGRHDEKEIEAAKEYIRQNFTGPDLRSLLTILDGLEDLRGQQGRNGRSAYKTPSPSLMTAAESPEAVPDPATMEREILEMLGDSDRFSAGPGTGEAIIEYAREIFRKQHLMFVVLRDRKSRLPLSRSEAINQVHRAFLQLEPADQARIFNAIRRDYLRQRKSNLGSVAKLINEEKEEP